MILALGLVRCRQRWCDAIAIMNSWCEVNKSCSMMLWQEGVMIGVALSTSRGSRRLRQEDMVMDASTAIARPRQGAHDRHCDSVQGEMDWRSAV